MTGIPGKWHRWTTRLAVSRVRSSGIQARDRASGRGFLYDPNNPSAPPARQATNGPSPTDRAASKMAGQLAYEATGSWRQRKNARNALAQSDASKSAPDENTTLVIGPGICQAIRPFMGRRPEDAHRDAQAQRDPRNSEVASSLDSGGTRPPFFLRDTGDPAASIKERERRHKLNKLADPAFGKGESKPTRAQSTARDGSDILGRKSDQNL